MLSRSIKYARRILSIVSMVHIPAGPLHNQRGHLPMPESVNYSVSTQTPTAFDRLNNRLLKKMNLPAGACNRVLDPKLHAALFGGQL